MKLSVLALDYDGTIAVDGRMDSTVAATLGRARQRGIVVVLVTGRRLSELRPLVGDLTLFDAVVAENGAVLSFPRSGRSLTLAQPAYPPFVASLRARGLDVRVGECVVELPADAAPAVLEEVRRGELPFALLFNRSRLMVLPQSVSKATGLREALTALRRSAHNALAVGDAENDHELLRSVECGLAVEWGSKALIAVADDVVRGRGPSDVARALEPLLESGRLPRPERPRHRLLVGQSSGGEPVHLSILDRHLLIAGDPRSGKSWVAGLLAEQLILHHYSVCVIDPEGDYRGLEVLPGVRVLGGGPHVPAAGELLRALAYPDVSVVIDLSQVAHADKHEYIRTTLRALAALRRRTGLPHRIVLDEAHYFLSGEDALDVLDVDTSGSTLVTYRASSLAPAVLAQVQVMVMTRCTDAQELDVFMRVGGWRGNGEELRELVGRLDLHEAVILPVSAETGGALLRVGLAPRLTSHVRHRTKYLDVEVPPSRAFVFGGQPPLRGQQVRSLHQCAESLAATSGPAIDAHLLAHDFSRWVADVFGDATLARELRSIEDRYVLGFAADVTGELAHAIRRRYLPDAHVGRGAS